MRISPKSFTRCYLPPEAISRIGLWTRDRTGPETALAACQTQRSPRVLSGAAVGTCQAVRSLESRQALNGVRLVTAAAITSPTCCSFAGIT